MVHEDSDSPLSPPPNLMNKQSSSLHYKRPSRSRLPEAKRSRMTTDLEFSSDGSEESNFSDDWQSSGSTELNTELNIADYIIYEPTGGQVLNSKKAREQHNKFMDRLQWVPESDINNPWHPWKHEGEIWLTDLLFRNGNISQVTIDNLLGAFAKGRISMRDGPIQFTNSREMLELLDVAARQGTVCSRVLILCSDD